MNKSNSGYRKDSYVMIDELNIKEEDEEGKDDMIYSKIEVMASNPQQQHQRVSAKENTWVRDEDLYGYD